MKEEKPGPRKDVTESPSAAEEVTQTSEIDEFHLLATMDAWSAESNSDSGDDNVEKTVVGNFCPHENVHVKFPLWEGGRTRQILVYLWYIRLLVRREGPS